MDLGLDGWRGEKGIHDGSMVPGEKDLLAERSSTLLDPLSKETEKHD